ncbi:MAG: hypothetical protein ABIQ93_16315 [Saprospiraceae bacterium]
MQLQIPTTKMLTPYLQNKVWFDTKKCLNSLAQNVRTNAREGLRPETRGDALKAFLEKNGHSTSTYMIQQNQTAFRVMEMNREGDILRLETILYGPLGIPPSTTKSNKEG